MHRKQTNNTRDWSRCSSYPHGKIKAYSYLGNNGVLSYHMGQVHILQPSHATPNLTLGSWFPKWGPRPVASASPWNFLEMHDLWSHPKPAESQDLGVGPVPHAPSRKFWSTFTLKNCGTRNGHTCVPRRYPPGMVTVAKITENPNAPTPGV
jgi:hypothetical protein